MTEPADPSATGTIDPADVEVRPEPTAAELTAILTAYEQLWPDPVLDAPPPSPRWRWAGRPWVRRSTYGGWR